MNIIITNYLRAVFIFLFFFNDTATTEIYTLSLHDALPISLDRTMGSLVVGAEVCLPIGMESPVSHTAPLDTTSRSLGCELSVGDSQLTGGFRRRWRIRCRRQMRRVQLGVLRRTRRRDV